MLRELRRARVLIAVVLIAIVAFCLLMWLVVAPHMVVVNIIGTCAMGIPFFGTLWMLYLVQCEIKDIEG